MYNSFISEKGAGTSESIEFKQIELSSQTPKSQTITKTQILPAGDPRNNTALAESGYRTYRHRAFTAPPTNNLDRLQPSEVYMEYCENSDESVTMRDNEASVAINYYKTMDGLSYFQLPRRWAFDNYRDINGVYNTAPKQWAEHDALRRGRVRSESVQICDDGDLLVPAVADTQVFRNIDEVYGYVLDDYKLLLDNRDDIPVALPVRGVLRKGRVQKVILKNDNSRYTILKRKKNLMYPQHPLPRYLPPWNAALEADFIPPYYAAYPESFDYVVFADKVDLRVEPGFTSSQYVSEELTRQLRSLNKDENTDLLRTPDPTAIKTLTTIEQFVETATYKRFATSNDHYGAEKFYHEILDNSTPPTAPATIVGINGPTDLNKVGNDYQFASPHHIITYLQQYQYIGCKRPELYVAGSEANDIFGYQVNSFTPMGQVLNVDWFQENPLQIALQYTPENLLKLKRLMDAQANHPELFEKENILNMYEPTFGQYQERTDNPYVAIVAGTAPAEQIVESWVNIDNARYLHMNPHNSSYYNNLLDDDDKLDANWRDYAQLGCGYYDFRGNFITNVDTGATDANQFSRQLNDTAEGGRVAELRYNSLPFMFHRNPDLADTLFSNELVINENSEGGNYTYGCFGRDSVRGEILVYPNMIKATNNFGDPIGVGLPNAFFTDQDGAGNFLIQRGRKVGFDRHFNAWGNACICLTSGIPRLEYQQAYDGTKDFWGTTAQYGMSGFPLNAPDNNPVEGIYSHRLPSGVEIENDLQPFLNKAYLGADAPAIVYDGAHFSFKDLHTPLNKGNLNTLAGNTLDSGDEDQVVYKINPQQSYNNLTPTQLPYEETLKFSYGPIGSANQEKRRMNRNLDPFTVYDTTTGIFIQDFGFTEDVWNDSLWGRLGFTYDQFHNSNTLERQKRYTDFTDTSNILTTNADVKSRDIKSWMQNKFGEATYTGMLFHPAQFTAFQATNSTPSAPPIAATTALLEFLPEIIAPTDSVSIVARDYPTQISHGFYNIRSDIALNAQSVLGGGDTAYPIVGIADKTNSLKDFFISSPSSITHTITRPVTISSITTSICDPDGTPARCSPNSVIIYRVTRTIDTSFDILGDLKRKLQELEEEKKTGKK